MVRVSLALLGAALLAATGCRLGQSRTGEEDKGPLERVVPMVSVVAGAATVTEGEAAAFTLLAKPPPANELTVNLGVEETGETLAERTTTTATIATGEAEAAFSVATTGDTDDEDDSVVTVTVRAGDGYAVGTPSSAEVTVADDDGEDSEEPSTQEGRGPSVSVAAVESPVNEGEPAAFVLAMDPPPGAALTVNLAVAETGRMLAEARPETVTLAAGERSVTVALATAQDEVDERYSEVSATVTAGTGYTVGQPGSATVKVLDDDPDAVTIAAVRERVTEGADVEFTVAVQEPPATDVVVTVAVSEDQSMLARTGAFAATIDTSGIATLAVATASDSVDEPQSTVTATLTAATGGYLIGDPSSAEVVILDDDPPPRVGTAGWGGIICEEEQTLRYGISVSNPIGRPIEVILTAEDSVLGSLDDILVTVSPSDTTPSDWDCGSNAVCKTFRYAAPDDGISGSSAPDRSITLTIVGPRSDDQSYEVSSCCLSYTHKVYDKTHRSCS